MCESFSFFRLCVTEDTVDFLSKILEQVATVCRKPENKHDENVKKLAKTVFKCLRNAVALSSTNQNLICHDTELIQNTFDIVENYILSEESMNKSVTEMWMQFLCNIVVNNIETGKKIWHTFFDYRSRYALHMNPEYQYYTCALLYNILKNGEADEKTEDEIFSMFTAILFSKVNNDENEYLDFLIDYYLKNEILIIRYPQVKPSEMRILQTLRDNLWSDMDKDKVGR